MNKIALIIVLILSGVFIISQITQAQSTSEEFMINWKSSGFTPLYYLGKVLATKRTSVVVSFNLVRENKLVDLSDQQVSWFINNKPFEQGRGLQVINIEPIDNGADILVRIETAGTEHNFIIPLHQPDLVIENSDSTFRSWPFFMAVDNLNDINFQWSINGRASEGEVNQPNLLEIVFVDGDRQLEVINLRAGAQNKLNPVEVVSEQINLTLIQ